MRIITPYGKTKRESQGADNGFNVRKNSTGSLFTRRTFNLIEGSNVTLTVADDDVDDEIDVTVEAIGSVSMGDAFGTIAVGGEDSVVADAASDTVTFAGLGGVAITTDAASDQVTFSLSGGITGTGLTMSSGYLLGRTTAGTGVIEEIEVGTGLALSAGVLSATGGISGLSAADPALSNELVGTQSGVGKSFELAYVLALNPGTPGGRLSIDSSLPVPTIDVTGTTIYYHPYLNNLMTLWDGTRWVAVTFSTTSLALGTMTQNFPYDVFGYLSGGVLTLEKVAWSTTTSRVTDVTLQDGRYCKSGDKTRLYLGTIATASSTTIVTDTASETVSGRGRLVWNMYNRVRRHMSFKAATDTWTYTTASFRAWPNNLAENSGMWFVRGLDIEPTRMDFIALTNQTGTRTGIGLNSSSTSSATIMNNSSDRTRQAIYQGYPGIGLHYLQPLEYGTTSATWYGDNGAPTNTQFGWVGEVFA